MESETHHAGLDEPGYRLMSRAIKLVLILLSVVAICSVLSHGAIHWLKIRAGYSGYHYYGQRNLKPSAVLCGSSLAYDGINWGRVSDTLVGAIESWATPGSSPSEWEVDYRRASQIPNTFVVISPYDLNEYFLCDFRADIVPLRETIRDLLRCRLDWDLRGRVLNQYPQKFLRKLFPVVGRSDGVMVGVRAKILTLASGSSRADEGDAIRFGPAGALEVTEKVSDWSPGRLQRRLVLLRDACQSKHFFNGPKRMALQRLLRRAVCQGRVTMVVMPVSPVYQKEFLTASAAQDFEETLADLQHQYPQVESVRLDRISALDDNRMFRDFVHLNAYGQRIATLALISRLRTLTSPQ